MGSKISINIDTPQFNLSQWQYLPHEDILQDYGHYRTLRNIKTNQKIDQYEFMWGNQEEFIYYLKSYNWRACQENVVNSKYLLHRNQEEICSYSYSAYVYIEHMRLRLSQINDIPCPDNLYMLMESLQGYRKIYQHSKYFIVEENQICVDEIGNVKVWVNGDLSMNYPSIIVEQNQKLGEQEMVDAIINLIADNTDYETQPKPSFREYYNHKKKGTRGKKFDEARNLVFTYARLNHIQIPSRFDAIFNLSNQDVDGKTHTQQSIIDRKIMTIEENQNSRSQLHTNSIFQQQKYPYYQPEAQKWIRNIHPQQNQNMHIISIPPYFQPPLQYSFGSNMQNYPIHNPGSQIFLPQSQQRIPQLASIYGKKEDNFQAIPFISTIKQKEQLNTHNLHSNIQQMRQTLPNNQISSFLPNNQIQPQNCDELLDQKNILTDLPYKQVQSYFIKPKNKKKPINQQNKKYVIEQQKYDVKKSQIIIDSQSSNFYIDSNIFENNKLIESNINKKIKNRDDEVAKSVPIDNGYPILSKKNLSSLTSDNKAILSNIQSNKKWSSNHTFGFKKPPQKITNLQNKVKPMKYFYNLQQSFQIDPVIAADLARLS